MPRVRKVDQDTFIDLLEKASETELRFVTCSVGRTTGWSSGDRVIPDHVLWFIHQGSILGRLGDEEIVVPTECFHWISSQVPHDLRVTVRNEVLRNYVVRFQLWQGRTLIVPDLDRLALMGFARGNLLMEQLCHAALQPQRFRFREMRALLLCLVAEAITHQKQRVSEVSNPWFSDQQMEGLVTLLTERWKQGMRPVDMANYFGLSTDYFTRKFRAQIGLSPREWLKQQRLRQASVMLLESGLRVQEIAFELGFADPHFFSRQFGRHYGVAPTQYRRHTNRGATGFHSSPSK